LRFYNADRIVLIFFVFCFIHNYITVELLQQRLFFSYTISKSKMISRRLVRGDEAYNLKVTRYKYVEEADNDANKDSALI
jgi:hypothetical protein